MLHKISAVLVFVFLCAAHTNAQEMQVIHFDGQSAYVQLPSGIFDQEENATIEAWVKWEQFNEWSRVFDFGREGNAVVVQNNKKSSQINFRIWDKKGKAHGIQAKKVVLVNAWHHIAVVCGTGGMRIYVDGTFYDDDDFRGGLNQAYGGNYYLGKSNWPKDKLFAGMMAEFRVWNYQRSQDEIRRAMKVALTGNEEGLIGYWPMHEIKDGEIPDLSVGANHAKIYGNIQLVKIKAISGELIRGEPGQVVSAKTGTGHGGVSALPRSKSDYLAYTVGEKAEYPLPEHINDIETKYLLTLKWGAYTGSQSRVMVLPVEITAQSATTVYKHTQDGKVANEIEVTSQSKASGIEIEAIVIDVLNQTGRFRLVERQVLESVLDEQDLAKSGRVANPSVAKTGNVLGAQYLMKVVVTDYEENVSGGGGGGIGGGLLSRAVGLGGVGISKSESRVGMNFRLIDAETSEVLYTKQIESKIKQSNLTLGGGLIGKGGKLGGAAFSKYSKTPIGQAVIAGINKGVYEIVKQIGSLPASGYVIKVEGDKIWLNIGKDVVSPGDVLKVKSKGEELIDPETGISLGSDDREIGTASVSQAEEKFSIAEVVSITGTVKRGDKVVSTILPPRIKFAGKRGKYW